MLAETEWKDYQGEICDRVLGGCPRWVWAGPSLVGVDDHREQWECLRRRLAHLPRPAKVPVAEMIRAYEEATGTWIGCD